MGANSELHNFLAEIVGPGWHWFAKRLSANDTGQTGGHQVGFYVPKTLVFRIFPELQDGRPNPKVGLSLQIVSHDQLANPVLTYWNQATRDECHVTRLGGHWSAFQDPSNTAAIVLIAVRRLSGDRGEMKAWIARDRDDEDELENYLGPLLPGASFLRFMTADGRAEITEALAAAGTCDCELEPKELPEPWRVRFPRFPTTDELTNEAVRRCRRPDTSPDERLVSRYICEYALFRAVEKAVELPGLQSFQTIDEFTERALSIINRRKTRAGTSLELHVAAIFREEGIDFERGGQTERGNRPDFLLPSAAAYTVAPAGDFSIRMLAVKTTLKDRWRQILEEADKIPLKHLLTLDTGISEPQFEQIRAAGVQVVVPASRARNYPMSVRSQLITFAQFIDLVRS